MLKQNKKNNYVFKILLLISIMLVVQLGFGMLNNVQATDENVSTNVQQEEKKEETKRKSIKDLKIKVLGNPYSYTGEERNAKVEVYNGKKKLKKGKDYKLTYKNNINAGKASVKITGIGKYKNSVTKYYNIAPKKAKITEVLLNSKGTRATISWNEDKQATGYIIYMSTSKNGEFEKIKTIKQNDITSYVKKGLNSKETYYFKIKSYKLIDDKKVKSKKFSNVKTDTGLISEVTLTAKSSIANRDHNLKLATSKINGMVLKPGAVFNWFNIIGSASAEKGYKQAPVFMNGKSVPGYGGGVCQVSSTIYQACKRIKLQILERHIHSLPVTYAKRGEDATVAYGSKNLKIRNNKNYSIKIVTYSGKAQVTCKLYHVTD